jgi:hypothetical protein
LIDQTLLPTARLPAIKRECSQPMMATFGPPHRLPTWLERIIVIVTTTPTLAGALTSVKRDSDGNRWSGMAETVSARKRAMDRADIRYHLCCAGALPVVPLPTVRCADGGTVRLKTAVHGPTLRRVTVRNQCTRWGSC